LILQLPQLASFSILFLAFILFYDKRDNLVKIYHPS
jgi:hypothetical protein